MAIGPVDFQPIMPKVTEVARSQNEQQQKAIGGAQQQAESIVRHAEQNTRSVHSQDEANKAVIVDKEREKNKGGKRQSKRNGGDADNGEKTGSGKKDDGRLPQERHTIDIRL